MLGASPSSSPTALDFFSRFTFAPAVKRLRTSPDVSLSLREPLREEACEALPPGPYIASATGWRERYASMGPT